MKKRSTRSKIRHGTRKPCRSTAIFARAETVPAEFCQVIEHKENVGTFKKRRWTAIFDRGGCVRAKVNCSIYPLKEKINISGKKISI